MRIQNAPLATSGIAPVRHRAHAVQRRERCHEEGGAPLSDPSRTLLLP